MWLSGYIGDEDLNSLKELGTAQGAIHFPGLVSGWATREEAHAALNLLTNEGKQSTHKTIIKVSGAKHLKFLTCRLVAHRVNGKVDKHSETDGIQEFEVTAAAWSGAATIKEWE